MRQSNSGTFDLLRPFAPTLSQDPALRSFLTNPSVQRTEKVEATKALVEKSSVSPLVKNLFVAMAENGALGITDGILGAFNKIMCAQRKEVIITRDWLMYMRSFECLRKSVNRFTLMWYEAVELSHHFGFVSFGLISDLFFKCF